LPFWNFPSNKATVSSYDNKCRIIDFKAKSDDAAWEHARKEFQSAHGFLISVERASS
jgi:hypothetical protein